MLIDVAMWIFGRHAKVVRWSGLVAMGMISEKAAGGEAVSVEFVYHM